MGVKTRGDMVAAILRGLLSSKLVWVALSCGLLFVAARRAQEGLAKDPRFLARPIAKGFPVGREQQ